MNCEERIYSNEYLDIIAEFADSEAIANYFTDDYCYQNISNCFGFLCVRRSKIPTYNVPLYGYSYVPKLYTTLQENTEFDRFNLTESGIYATQSAPYNLTGDGVVVGFIDTGIDYTNPVFRNPDGTTRILALWDQTIRDGTPPQDILYGTEYSRDQINKALRSNDPYSIVPSKDEDGHGTAVASVACGSKLDGGRTYIGAAPGAQIVAVKLKEAKPYLKEYYLIDESVKCYQETDILCALKYLDSYAITLKRPLVVCIALGSNMAGHTGDSKLAENIARIAEKKSRVVVTAAGNEGMAAHHYQGELSSKMPKDIIQINVEKKMKGFMVEFWGQTPYLFGVSVRSPQGEVTPTAVLRGKKSQTVRYKRSGSTVLFDALAIEQNTGRLLVEIRIIDPGPGVWEVIVENQANMIGGQYDLYLPITEFLSSKVTFSRPNPYSTIVNPAYCDQSITVVAYDSRNMNVSDQSGRGYSLNGAIKPDLAVPGVDVPTILGVRSGSSFAAALAVGGIAQLLEWGVIQNNDVMMDSGDVKSYLIRGAIREDNLEYPNPIWGYGLFNMKNVFAYLKSFV